MPLKTLTALIDTNLTGHSNTELIVYTGTVAACMTVHPAYQGHWPEVVTTPQMLTEQTETFKALVDAAANRDMQKVADRNACRAELEQSVSIIALYAVMMYLKTKDINVLLNTGLKLKDRTSKRSTGTASPAVPLSKLTVKHGDFSGTVVVRGRRVAGAGVQELQMSEGEPSSEESWKEVGTYRLCSHIEVKGLTPGQKYFFRMRPHTDNGLGPWSSIVSIICL